MTKKITALLLAALLTFSAVTLLSCNKEDGEGETTTAGESQSAAEETTAAPETEPEETDPPKKRDKTVYVDMYVDDGGNHTPVSLMAEGSSVAARIVAEGYLNAASIACPSWSNNIGNLTMRVYTWNTDYATTVAGTPVFEQEYVDYADNDTLLAEFGTEESKGLPAGEYLWWLGNGVDESGSGVGLYAKQYPAEESTIVELYQNGEVITNLGWEGSFDIVIPGE